MREKTADPQFTISATSFEFRKVEFSDIFALNHPSAITCYYKQLQ